MTLAVPKDSDQHLSTAEVCSLVGQPDADTVLHVERLRYLRQLVAGAPSELWALVRLDLPYLRALQSSMAWLYSWVHRTTDLPCPNTEPEPWTSLMCQAPGRFKGLVRRARGLVDPATYHKGLLEALLTLDRVDCDTVWSTIKDFVEPLSVLRATVDLWASTPCVVPDVAEVAEDVKLMLDPQPCCEEFRASRVSGESADTFAGLDWRPSCQLPFVLTGDVAVFRLEDPPLKGYVYPFTCSLPLAAASGFMRWFEASCDVLGAFAQTSAAHPVSLHASAAALAELEPASAWLLRAGFVQTASGLRSPGS
ncbi:TKL-1 [Symbiodinium sp. CCMP2592]|nr:TKL-1 [Symbiodinium sp. CCMP2592]